jgi:hypothetical protein
VLVEINIDVLEPCTLLTIVFSVANTFLFAFVRPNSGPGALASTATHSLTDKLGYPARDSLHRTLFYKYHLHYLAILGS